MGLAAGCKARGAAGGSAGRHGRAHPRFAEIQSALDAQSGRLGGFTVRVSESQLWGRSGGFYFPRHTDSFCNRNETGAHKAALTPGTASPPWVRPGGSGRWVTVWQPGTPGRAALPTPTPRSLWALIFHPSAAPGRESAAVDQSASLRLGVAAALCPAWGRGDPAGRQGATGCPGWPAGHGERGWCVQWGASQGVGV